MDATTALARLEALGTERLRKQNARNGAPEKQFGAKLGDVRKVAKEIKSDHALAAELWDTGIVEAQMLATLVCKPADFTLDELDQMVLTTAWSRVADWWNAYVINKHPEADSRRENWMDSENIWAARSGWHLTARRVARNPDGLELALLLDRIESEMPAADPEVQWTMNMALVEIGIHHPDHRERALEIGERLGLYRDYPERKGCTSPFAPIWIREMVKRQS